MAHLCIIVAGTTVALPYYPAPLRRSSRRCSSPVSSVSPHGIEPETPPLAPAANLKRDIIESDGEPRRWNAFQKLASRALEALEDGLVAPLEHRRKLPRSADPAVQLAGNFAPVPETPVRHALPVDGSLPDCLDGVYVRNGANPMMPPRGGHHLFDGDGMLHAVTLRPGGHVSYCCRFTRTQRLTTEARIGRSIYPRAVGQLHGHAGLARLALHAARGLCGLLDTERGMGPANAGVVFFAGRLLAMSEDDLPYAVRVTPAGDLRTDGRFDFGGQLPGAGVCSLVAHPRVDPATGEMFALSYDVLRRPHLRLCRFDSGGALLGPAAAIHLPGPTMVHDFAITERHVVIPDQQLVFRLRRLLTGGSPVVRDPAKVCRFGVMPRYDADDRRIRWMEVPGCFCLHLWNAWEEEEEERVTVVASCMSPPDAMFRDDDDHGALRSTLSEITLDLRAGTSARREIVAGTTLEAGSVNPWRVGRRTRFAYMAVAEPWPRVSAVVKVDLLERRVVARHDFPAGCFGGEPLFVPRHQSSTCACCEEAEEDDGHVLTFMHWEEGQGQGQGESVSPHGPAQLLVLGGSDLEKVAAVGLPSRVPYGFHATFVPHDKLHRQHC